MLSGLCVCIYDLALKMSSVLSSWKIVLCCIIEVNVEHFCETMDC